MPQETRDQVVDMVSADEGWAVGEDGAILKNIGPVWLPVSSPPSNRLTSVDMVSANEGWAVGSGGTILHGAVVASNTISLSAGWNLVSFNVAPVDVAPSSILAPITDTLIVAQGYDGGGLSYYPGGAQNTLTSMDAQHGYWLKLTGAATLAITGTKPATTTIPLHAGWNLIGYLPDVAMLREIALDSIADKYTTLLGFDRGAVSWYAVLPDNMNTLTMMYPRRGYWIFMTEAAELVYP